jgi:hypothetical protein
MGPLAIATTSSRAQRKIIDISTTSIYAILPNGPNSNVFNTFAPILSSPKFGQIAFRRTPLPPYFAKCVQIKGLRRRRVQVYANKRFNCRGAACCALVRQLRRRGYVSLSFLKLFLSASAFNAFSYLFPPPKSAL